MGIEELVNNSVTTLVNAATNVNDPWHTFIIILAVLGFFSIAAAIFSKSTEAIGIMFKIFIVLPLIIIVNLLNKKKRKERLKAWGEFKQDLKNKKISKKMWVFWIFTKILLPLIILAFIILQFFL